MMEELLTRSAVDLGRLIRDGEVTSGDPVQAAIQRAVELNEQIGAF